MASVMNLKELLERKKAEKEAAAKAAVAAAEAQKTATAKAAAETAGVINEAKNLVLELLALTVGEPDEETRTVLETQYAELPGLRGAVEQEMRSRKLAAEQEIRWKKVAAFEKEIENLPTDQLTYGLASRLVEFGALEEITPERKDGIFAYNKTVREAGTPTRQTFVRHAFQKEGRVSHFYLDKKKWLGDALNKHHRALEQSRKMLAGRHDVKPTYSSGKPVGQTATGAALNNAKGAETPPPELPKEEPKLSRKMRRAPIQPVLPPVEELGEEVAGRPKGKVKGGGGAKRISVDAGAEA